ncbi:hypothetical protein [Sulfurimonas sp. NWX367]|uniref:hypothetical protein n=1 Tax=unclassified Sulfurimonas TaxID=2623549 RepID=UPI003204C421
MLKKLTIGMLLVSSAVFAKVSYEYAINIVGMSMDYKESENGVFLDSEESDFADLKGLEIQYKYIKQTETSQDFDTVSINIMAVGGNTEYKGAYIGSNLGYGSLVSITSNQIYDMEIDFAHTYEDRSSFTTTISLGVGYRFWRRKLSAQQIEDYTWFSLRPSVSFSYMYYDLRIAPKFEFQYGLGPRMSATGISDDFKLGSANIMEFTLPIKYAITQKFSLYAAYTYQYQKIEESNVVYDNTGTGYLEPESKVYNEYIKFGIVFKY